jgi:uncharacterized protein YjiK
VPAPAASKSANLQAIYPAFPYNLEDPDETFVMPAKLVEISGISLTADRTQMAVNNDEQGIIFLLNKSTGQVEKEIAFKEDGDFEGIEIVGNYAFVIKSSGTIYRVRNYTSEKPEVTKFKSFLNKENDVEGLGYDAVANQLLVGCKGKGVDGDGAAQKSHLRFRPEYYGNEA